MYPRGRINIVRSTCVVDLIRLCMSKYILIYSMSGLYGLCPTDEFAKLPAIVRSLVNTTHPESHSGVFENRHRQTQKVICRSRRLMQDTNDSFLLQNARARWFAALDWSVTLARTAQACYHVSCSSCYIFHTISTIVSSHCYNSTPQPMGTVISISQRDSTR